MRIRLPIALGAFLVVGAITATADTYPNDLFWYNGFHIDLTTQPQGIGDLLHNKTVQAFGDTIAAAYGVNPVYVNLALHAAPRTQPSDTVTNYGLPLPSGYAFCAATVSVYFILGDDTQIAAGNRANGTVLAVQVRTPHGPIFSGSSRVSADVEEVGIKSEFLQQFQQQGICKGPTDEAGYILRCKGGGAGKCPSVTWGNVAAAGQTFPALAQ